MKKIIIIVVALLAIGSAFLAFYLIYSTTNKSKDNDTRNDGTGNGVKEPLEESEMTDENVDAGGWLI